MLKDYLSKLFPLAALLCFSLVAFGQNVNITAPASIAGDYPARPAAFGPPVSDISGELVLGDDGDLTDVNNDGIAGTVNDGCQPLINDVAGKIVLLDRGECGFLNKAQAAQDAGAAAVILCNNAVATPDLIITAGGVDPGTFTIPTVMLSYNSCLTIRTELANGPVMGSLVAPVASESCETAIPAVEGLNNAPAMTGGGALLSDGATSGLFYTFTPASDALMTVSACGNGVDTRLYLLGDGCDVLTTLTTNDDCDAGNNDFGSEVVYPVTGGTEYIIYWDDRWENAPFDWTLTLSALPNVDVTFNVDMKNEVVAPDGVKLIVNGGAEIDMVDNADGTWSYTGSFTATEVLDYRYANGSGNVEDNPDLANCRTIEVGLAPINTNFLCFNSCSICPPDVACPNWIDDDFESYTLGGLSAQSNDWSSWTPGSPTEDAVVSDAFAFSGTQSMNISAADPDDQLLLLGDRTSGHFILKWKMYVPSGSGAYYNLQKDQDTPGVGDAFANEVVFNADGTGVYNVGNQTFNFTYPHDEWFEVYHDFDLDNNWTRVWIDAKSVVEHPASWQASTQTGITQVGAVDFFGFNTVSANYFVDDVLFKQVEACPADAIICDGLDAYDLGTPGTQSPWWGSWSLTPGAADEAVVSNNQFLSCEQALEVTEAGGDDVLLFLGDRTDGNYWLSWNMYIPAGQAGYYNTQKVQNTPGNQFGIQVEFFTDGTATLDAGAADVVTFNFSHDQWFNVAHSYDLDNNWATMYIDGVEIYSWPANWQTFQQNGLLQLGAVNFFGNTDVVQYIDDVLFVQLPSVPGDFCATAHDLNSYLGQGQGSTVSTPLFDNTFYTTNQFEPQTPEDGFDCFGEPDGLGASPELNNTIWFTFTGDGQTYFIETGACNATDYIEDGDTQMAIFTGDCNGLVPVACNEDGPNATTGNYISGMELATTAGTVYYMLIDGFNLNGTNLSGGEFCINFSQLTGAQIVDVTFEVDMSLESGVNPDEVYIAGGFNGWTDQQMTSIGANKYRATLSLEVGTSYQYKFKNGTNGWENNDDLADCGVDDGFGGFNREYTVEATPAVQAFCFNWCVACSEVSTVDPAFVKALSISPNPAGDFVNVNYNFDASTNLNVRLINMLGQTLVIRNYDNSLTGTEKIDISNLPSGAYTVVFSNGESTFGKRLIVE